jgi:uncharacterized membrane protein YfcA
MVAAEVGSGEIALDSDAVVTGAARAEYAGRSGFVLRVRLLTIASHLRMAPSTRKNDFCETKPTSVLFSTNVPQHHFGVTLIGFFAGILVGVTSIGSGSVIRMLLVFYGFAPSVMVGTDIVRDIFLAGLTGALQLGLGNVDLRLVACVIVGSIPGGLLGAYLTSTCPHAVFDKFFVPFW